MFGIPNINKTDYNTKLYHSLFFYLSVFLVEHYTTMAFSI